MNGYLHILPYNALQDWQKQGFYGNTDFGIKHCPTVKLLPFFFDIAKNLTVSEFKFQLISPRSTRNDVIISSELSLSTALLSLENGTYSNRLIFKANTDIADLLTGYWQFYIKLDDNSEFRSELIHIPLPVDMVDILPDFNDDFNEDFNI